MKYLFDEWNEITARFKDKIIFLFLDYDGTISPIVEQPDKAFIPETIQKTLNQLVLDNDFRVAIISGRSLKDIKDRVNMTGIIYSGNHGLEISGPGFHYEYELPGPYTQTLTNIKNELRYIFAGIEGVIIEDKRATLSIHYRMADKSVLPDLHSIIGRYYDNKIIQIREEKKTIEIVPLLAWNKGNAVLSILKDSTHSGKELFPIYLGDSLTDEHAFIALNDIGLTVRIGPDQYSSAQYYLNDVSDVNLFLKGLVARKS